MKLLFSPPSIDDLIRLLKAWRFWSLGALLGGLLGAGVFYIAPPPYRAHAVVLVDFNLEEAWPQETDRQQFYYLERETRKLEELAFSDAVLDEVAEMNQGLTFQELRESDKLSLSQPAEGGWNFYADDADPQRAASLATAWANAFVQTVRVHMASMDGLSNFINVETTRTPGIPVERSLSMSLYIFTGAVIFLMLGSIVVLFVHRPDKFSGTSTEHGASDLKG